MAPIRNKGRTFRINEGASTSKENEKKRENGPSTSNGQKFRINEGASTSKGREFRINEGASTSKVHGYELLMKENNDLTTKFPGIWIECSHCKKWRNTYQYFEQDEVPPLWNCTMWKKDGEVGSCDIPGDTEEPDLEHEPFPEGTVAWAKLGRYPYWPSMVESDPITMVSTCTMKTGQKKYHVTFFGSPPTHGWVSASRMKKYQKTDPKTANSKNLEDSIIQGNEAVGTPFQERIINYTFPNLLVKYEVNKTAKLNGFLEDHSDESEEDDEKGPSTDGIEDEETENSAAPEQPAEMRQAAAPEQPAEMRQAAAPEQPAEMRQAAAPEQPAEMQQAAAEAEDLPAFNDNLPEEAIFYRDTVVAQIPSLWGPDPAAYFRMIYARESL